MMKVLCRDTDLATWIIVFIWKSSYATEIVGKLALILNWSKDEVNLNLMRIDRFVISTFISLGGM